MKQNTLAAMVWSTFLLLTACNLPGSEAPNSSALSTSAAQTVQAVLSTPSATQVPAVLPTATAAVQTTSTPECEDIAMYTLWTRDDVTYDVKEMDKPLPPGKAFTMAWTLQNTGTCTWTSKYQMQYDSGTRLTDPSSFPVIPTGDTVPPGGTIHVSIVMTAPEKAGDYDTVFRLQNGRGESAILLAVTTKVGSASSALLAAPGNLRYEYDCTSGTVNISLYWIDKASDEDGYRIYRDGTKLADLPAGSTTYSDIAPTSGKYDYTVAAFSGSGESPANVKVNTANCG